MESIIYEYSRDKSAEMSIFMSKSGKVQRHFHRSIEILYILSGGIECKIGDESFFAEENDIIFVHNYFPHAFLPNDEYDKYVIIFPENYGNDIGKLLKESTLPSHLSDKEFNKECILPIFNQMFLEKDEMPHLVKKGYLNVIFGRLFDKYPQKQIKTASSTEFMVDVLSYIDEHYSDNLTLDSIASEFGYNKYYFSRIFNKYVGEGLTNYVNVVRVRNFMKKFKENSSPQISKLAFECGFDAMPTFYRAFSKVYGKSPKAYFKK